MPARHRSERTIALRLRLPSDPVDGAPDVNAAVASENAQQPAQAQPSDQPTAQEALAKEKAKSAAAEAKLAALKKAQAKAAAPTDGEGRHSSEERQSRSGGDHRHSRRRQCRQRHCRGSIRPIDDARGLAKQVMRTGGSRDGSGAQLRQNISRRSRPRCAGSRARRKRRQLLKQAEQTRQYIAFLQKRRQQQDQAITASARLRRPSLNAPRSTRL